MTEGMFADGRSGRVIFAAHCILNQNAISDGTADYPAAHVEVVRDLLAAEVGIVQMPCPEFCCLGLDRGNPLGARSPVTVENTRIRAALGEPPAAGRLAALVDGVMLQLREYRRHGFEIVGVVGVNRSPSCGVETTSDQGRELPGRGLFLGALAQALAAEGFKVPVVGVKPGPGAADCVRRLL